MGEKQWFETWFDSPYYHILYDHRDFDEAEVFIKNLLNYLQPKSTDAFLDLACGAGRHSLFINSFGYQVLGADLSENSITKAKQFENENLNFLVQDMRHPIQGKKFDYVFNLFTSFGYFESRLENLIVLRSIKSMLNKNGTVIIDFLNATKAIENLVEIEQITKQGIDFKIKRKHEKGIIKKQIHFTDKGTDYAFEEQVQSLDLKDFNDLCNKAGFSIVKAFGNYALEEFDKNTSDRLIVVLQ